MREAAEPFFGIKEGRIQNLDAHERTRLAEHVQLVVCGTKNNPAYMVIDDGEGQPGVYGGPIGNLYLVLNVKPHKFFKRREDDIMLNLDINIAQAALGAEVEVPTVDGTDKLRIPPGTQPGKMFTLKGKGVSRLRKNGRGDQLVIVNVDIPTKLSGEQRELLEKLAKTLGTTPQPKEKGFLDRLNEALGG